MKVRIFYNSSRKEFVAKRSDGKVIAQSGNFAEVEVMAHRHATHIEYHYSSFPKSILEKLLGKTSSRKNGENFKSLFMNIVFSYRNSNPPDGLTRKIVRKILKKGLRYIDTVEIGNTVYIITFRKKEFFVFEIRHIKGHGWEFDVVRTKKHLPDKVVRTIEKHLEVID